MDFLNELQTVLEQDEDSITSFLIPGKHEGPPEDSIENAGKKLNRKSTQLRNITEEK